MILQEKTTAHNSSHAGLTTELSNKEANDAKAVEFHSAATHCRNADPSELLWLRSSERF